MEKKMRSEMRRNHWNENFGKNGRGKIPALREEVAENGLLSSLLLLNRLICCCGGS